ncbi:MAG: hypothetical protein P8181_08025 [bacterium]
MIIAEDGCLGLSRERDRNQFGHVRSDGLGVGTAELSLQLTASVFLVCGHAPLSTQLALGEVDEEVGVFLDRDMVVKGEVLTEFEALKAVDDEGAWRGCRLHVPPMKEHTVPAEPGEAIIDRLGRDTEVTGNLPVGHPPDGLHEDADVEVRAFLPVGRRERLRAEASVTGFALETLDTVGRMVTREESRPFEPPPV